MEDYPRAPADMAPGRHWGAGWGDSQGGSWRELQGVLPQARASWDSLDEEWGQAGSRAPVPSTVQANTFEFADAEEDDEVKV